MKRIRDPEKARQYSKTYQEKHREKELERCRLFSREQRKQRGPEINARRRELYAANPEKREKGRLQTRGWNERNPGASARASARQRLRLLDETVAAYGGKCMCCGESEKIFMTIDHINNDGAKERKGLGNRSGVHLYRSLKKRGFPQDGYRLSCFNCNLGRARNGGICPHEQPRLLNNFLVQR